ncbi:hypothetical protein BFJ71_g16306 [Fusarium oxysporum]|nr:hypothetical protein BFJ71_g16306 [Fusarium oxysporum]
MNIPCEPKTFKYFTAPISTSTHYFHINKARLASGEALISHPCKPPYPPGSNASDQQETDNSLACLQSAARSLPDKPSPDESCGSGDAATPEAIASPSHDTDDLLTATKSSPLVPASPSLMSPEIRQDSRHSFLWSYFVIRGTKIFLCWDTGKAGLNEIVNDPFTVALTSVAAYSRSLHLAALALSALLYSQDYPGSLTAGEVTWFQQQSLSALRETVLGQAEHPIGIILTALLVNLVDMHDETGSLEFARRAASHYCQQRSRSQIDSTYFDVAKHLLRWMYICKQLSFSKRIEPVDEATWTKLEFRHEELETTLCRRFSDWAIHPLYTVSHRWINPLMKLGRLVQLRYKAEHTSLPMNFDKQVSDLEEEILTAREKDLFVFMRGTNDLPDLTRLNEAIYSAVVLVFYTRLRDLAWTSVFARQQTLNVCEHAEAIGKYSRALNNIVFPVFLAGCEAVDLGIRERIVRLLSGLHPAGFWFHQETKLLANLQYVWTLRDDMPGALWPEWSRQGQ